MNEESDVIFTISDYVGRQMKVFPGTFIYAGFDKGTLYVSEEQSVWCNESNARSICKKEGLDFRQINPLRGYGESGLL